MQPRGRAPRETGARRHTGATRAKPDDNLMNLQRTTDSLKTRFGAPWIAALWALAAIAAPPAAAPLLLDDYSNPKTNKNGVDRILIDDKAAGSKSRATQTCKDGVLTVKGELAPGRGVPAFISEVSPLAADGKPVDLSAYQGVRLRVNVIKGVLVVQAGSTDVQNFDYHSSAPIAGGRGRFQEVRIPFKEMRRAWSEQTSLNPKTIISVNLVSFGAARDSFEYAVAEIGFY